MRATKIVIEAAAAALMATSFFAVPVGLASLQTDDEWTAVAAYDEGGDDARTVELLMAQVGPVSTTTASPADAVPPPPTPEELPEAAAPPTAPQVDGAPDAPSSRAEVLPMQSAKMPPAFRGRLATRQGQAPIKPRHIAQASVPTAALAAQGGSVQGKKKRKKRPCLEPDPRITTRGEDRYAVDRDLVDRYTADLDAAAKLAWVGWHRNAQGDVDGFKVKRIRCGSVLHQAGFRNGDVVHKVNGKAVTTIPQALFAYRKLRKKRSLRIELKRKGAQKELRYRLG
jgi:hypothetical protein